MKKTSILIDLRESSLNEKGAVVNCTIEGSNVRAAEMLASLMKVEPGITEIVVMALLMQDRIKVKAYDVNKNEQ